MKISELRDIDIKNIDVKQVNEFFVKKPNIAVSILLGVVSIFLVFKFFSEKQVESTRIKRTIDEVQKKIDAINQYNQSLKEFNEYVDALPVGLVGSALLDTLTEFAEKNNIRVLSFTPAQSQSSQFYDSTSISMDVSARNYKDLLLFVYEIENSPYNLRVNQWSESIENNREMVPSASEDSTPQDQPIHMITLSIDSISFKKI